MWHASRCAPGPATHAESQLVCCLCASLSVCGFMVWLCGGVVVGVWGEQVQEDLYRQVAVAHAAHPARHHGRVRHHDVPRPWQRRGPVLPHPLRLTVSVHELCGLSRPPALPVRSQDDGGQWGGGDGWLWGVSCLGVLWGLGGAEGLVRPSAALVVS